MIRVDPYEAIFVERIRQEERFGPIGQSCAHPDKPNVERLAILLEEVGEVARELNEAAIAEASPTHEPVGPKRLAEALERELVQVAAVAVAWIEGLHAAAEVVA